jgi:membrane-associated phospholipid phosphatase
VAIALGTLYFSYKYLPRIRHVHTVMTVLLCLSTVYCRYHYAVDVLAGIATAAVLLPLGNWLYWRFEEQTVAPPESAAALAVK